MFKRFKNWLRATIAEEVAKVSVSLTREREEAVATIKNVESEIARSFANEIATFEQRIKAMLEAEHNAFVLRLRHTREHIGNGEPSRWRADEDAVKADHALRKAK